MKTYDSVVDLLCECAADAHGMARLRDALGVGPESGWQQQCLAEVADLVEAELEAKREGVVFFEAECIRMRKVLADIDRTHMLLPVDAEGIPIRPGDLIESAYMKHGAMTVANVGRSDVYAYNEHEKGFFVAAVCHHVKPDTLESLLQEFAGRVCHNGHQWGLDSEEVISNFAERIRKAVHDGD